jgi:hypothetical protein
MDQNKGTKRKQSLKETEPVGIPEHPESSGKEHRPDESKPLSPKQCQAILMPTRTAVYTFDRERVGAKSVASMLAALRAVVPKDVGLRVRVGTVSPDLKRPVSYYMDLFPGFPWLLYTVTPVHIPDNELNHGMKLNVKTLTGRTASIYVEPSHSIYYGMHAIEKAMGVPVDQQRIIFHGKQLDPGCMFADCNVQNDATLNLVLCMRGGGGQRPFAEIDKAEFVHGKWSTHAKPWRMCEPGLCLECVCSNEKCAAFRASVIVNCGYGTIDIVEDTFACPMCSKSVSPDRPMFNDTEWRFCGIKIKNGNVTMVPMSPWQTADDEGPTYMKEDTAESVSWANLLIETKDRQTLDACVTCLEPMGKMSAQPRACGHEAHERCDNDALCECPVCLMPWDKLAVSVARATERKAPERVTEVADPEAIHVMAHTLSGDRYVVPVEKLETTQVKEIQAYLRKRRNTPDDTRLVIVFAGKELKDPDATLSSLKVKSGSIIHLMERQE